jgi:hypothetical protein
MKAFSFSEVMRILHEQTHPTVTDELSDMAYSRMMSALFSSIKYVHYCDSVQFPSAASAVVVLANAAVRPKN